MKKILITGGSGFIGKNLVEHLSKKYEVYAPLHNELDLLEESSVDEFFKNNKFDIVIHAAVKGGSRKLLSFPEMLKNNLKIFFNLLKNKDSYKKMIFIGSGAEYDKSREIKEAKEEDSEKNIPSEDYGFYKYLCSKYIEMSENIINLRVFGIFGKHEDYETRFVSNIICRVVFDLPVEMNQNALFDYVYADDLCRIIEYFIENEAKYKSYNIGGERHFELLEIAEMIKKISKKDFKIEIKNHGMNKEYTCDNSRLRKELKDFKFSDIETTIKELYDWYLENKDNIKKENLLTY